MKWPCSFSHFLLCAPCSVLDLANPLRTGTVSHSLLSLQWLVQGLTQSRCHMLCWDCLRISMSEPWGQNDLVKETWWESCSEVTTALLAGAHPCLYYYSDFSIWFYSSEVTIPLRRIRWVWTHINHYWGQWPDKPLTFHYQDKCLSFLISVMFIITRDLSPDNLSKSAWPCQHVASLSFQNCGGHLEPSHDFPKKTQGSTMVSFIFYHLAHQNSPFTHQGTLAELWILPPHCLTSFTELQVPLGRSAASVSLSLLAFTFHCY